MRGTNDGSLIGQMHHPLLICLYEAACEARLVRLEALGTTGASADLEFDKLALLPRIVPSHRPLLVIEARSSGYARTPAHDTVDPAKSRQPPTPAKDWPA